MYGGHNRRTQPGDDVNRTNAGEEFKPYLELHGELTGIPPAAAALLRTATARMRSLAAGQRRPVRRAAGEGAG